MLIASRPSPSAILGLPMGGSLLRVSLLREVCSPTETYALPARRPEIERSPCRMQIYACPLRHDTTRQATCQSSRVLHRWRCKGGMRRPHRGDAAPRRQSRSEECRQGAEVERQGWIRVSLQCDTLRARPRGTRRALSFLPLSAQCNTSPVSDRILHFRPPIQISDTSGPATYRIK